MGEVRLGTSGTSKRHNTALGAGLGMIIGKSKAEHLARLLLDGRLILFVGAGISLQAKNTVTPDKRMPLWRELAQSVATSCHEELSNYGGDLFDLFDSIAQKNSRRVLEDAIRKIISENEYEPSELHLTLARLPWVRVYTTNYDNLLQRSFKEHYPIVSEGDFELLSRPISEQPKLIHLHGTFANMHTLSGEDYARWPERHPRAMNRIVSDGSEHSFLFLGYSNSDPHFRHTILPLIRELKTDRGHKNYSWMWNPSDDQIRLLQSRGLEAHPIQTDGEWLESASILLEAYERLKNSNGRGRTTKGRTAVRPVDGVKDVKINGYKLFYYRDHKSISRMNLSQKTKIPVDRIRILETVDRSKPLGSDCFKVCSAYDIISLEKALRCDTSLAFGRDDDFLAYYIEYYKNNWQKPRGKRGVQQAQLFSGKTKAVVFDFGGTLTRPTFRESTWERIWQSVGYTLQDAAKLHHEFSAGKITHKEWCDQTRDSLRIRGFSRDHFEEVIKGVEPIDGLAETFENLRSRKIRIHIVSGSLRAIIERVIDKSFKHVDSVTCNDFEFDANGVISRVIGHDYDFEGKANFIRRVAADLHCHPIEVLFVGNSLNDEKAANSGARTLCVNPKHTHHYVSSMWNNTIRDMKNLKEILDYV